MTPEEELQYFDLCLRMMRIGLPEYITARILAASKLLRKKKGSANMKDVAKIMADNFRDYPNQPDPSEKNTPEPEQVEAVNNQ